MQVLKYIEDKFETLENRVKIELFLFPLIIFAFVFFMLLDESKNDYTKIEDTKLLNIQNIKMEENLVDILKNIEKFAKEKEIHLGNISNGEKSIKIEAFADIKNRIVFLSFLENYNSFSKLNSIEILDDRLLVQIDFNKLYKKDKIDISHKLSSFSIKEKVDYKLHAIVGDKVFINNKWFKLEDKIDTLKVFKIKKDSVVLKNNYKTLVLKLYKNETI